METVIDGKGERQRTQYRYKSQKVIYAPRSDEKLLTSYSKHSKEALCGEVAERLKALPC